MTQQAETFAGMHAEHRQWASEHSMWNDDIEAWRGQFESALAQLTQLEKLIRQHGENLDAHVQTIARLQRSLVDHEKSMAGYLSEGADVEGQESMCENHRQKAGYHVEQRQAHERIKKRHHTMMAHLAMLKGAIEGAK